MRILDFVPKDKWAKNCGPTLDKDLYDPNEKEFSVFGQEAERKMLGTKLFKKNDQLGLKVNIRDDKMITKRKASSQTATIFDLFGIAAAVLLIGKLLIQKMHSLKLKWDDPPPEELANAWVKWTSELHLLAEAKIARCIIKKEGAIKTDVHIFSDASKVGMGFVAYFRTVFEDGEVDVVYAYGKSAVVPLQNQANIQRLELEGVLFACEKTNIILKPLSIDINQIFFGQIAHIHCI